MQYKTAALPAGRSLAEALRRPDLDLAALAELLQHAAPELGVALATALGQAGEDVRRGVQTEIKYAGYLTRQRELVARTARLEATALPSELDYAKIAGLSHEVVEKLSRVRPRNLEL